jgi:2,5-furandicarboxylate decarboxylase 1
MPKDMRSWINQLDSAGEIVRISKPVDPLTEMGALLQQSKEKALLFENIKGHAGWTAVGNAPANLRHAALAFGTELQRLIPTVAAKMGSRLPCEMVETGPVKEVKQFGDEVDLCGLPVHVTGKRDAAPFIASGLCVTKNPDTKERNVSFHRLQLKGRNRTGALLVPRHTLANFQKYEERDEPMPIATVIGHHPLVYMAGATTLAYGEDEFEVAGGYMDEPLRMVKCETLDLEVPADAEIVLEGHILPHVREEEGPFAEFHDYYVGGFGKNPVVEWHAITRRRDAIFKNLQNGAETEGCVFHKVPMSATIFRRLQNIGGFVDLKNVLVQPGIFGVVVQLTQRYQGEAKNVLLGALSSEYFHPKMAIAVDEDVNLFNPTEVLWALSTRVDPERDITIISGVRTHAMDPTGDILGQTGTAGWQRLGSKVLIDATRPPLNDPERRKVFDRIEPPGFGTVKLEDFLK